MAERDLVSGVPLLNKIDLTLDLLDSNDSLRVKEGLARSAVEYSTRRCYDTHSILKVARKGFLLMQQGAFDKTPKGREKRRLSEVIIDGIDDYFSGDQIRYKILFDPSDPDASQEAAREIVNSCSLTATLLPSAFSGVLEVHKGVSAFFDAVVAGTDVKDPSMPRGANNILTIGRNITAYRSHPDYPVKRKVINLVGAGVKRKDELPPTMRIRAAEFYLDVLKADKDVPGAPRFIALERGNTSIERVVAAESPPAMAEDLLRFIAKLPEGDYLWQRILQGVFFNTFEGHEEIYATKREELFSNPEFIRQIFSLQVYMTDKLFLPLLYSNFEDKQFDQSFAQALKKLDNENIEELALAMYFCSIRRATTINLLGEPSWGNGKAPPLLYASERMDEYPASCGLLIAECEFRDYLFEQFEVLEKNFLERFKRSEKTMAFIERWRSMLKVDIRASAGRMLKDYFDTLPQDDLSLAQEDMRRRIIAQEKGEQVSVITNKEGVSIEDLKITERNGESYIGYKFDDGSLPATVGFHTIEISPFQGPDSSSPFILTFGSGPLGMVGEMHSDNTISFLSLHYESSIDEGVTYHIIEDAFRQLYKTIGLGDAGDISLADIVSRVKGMQIYPDAVALEEGVAQLELVDVTEEGLRAMGRSDIVQAASIHFEDGVSELKRRVMKRREISESTERIDEGMENLMRILQGGSNGEE